MKVSFVTIVCSQIGFDPVQSPDIFYSVNEFTWQGGGSSNPSSSSPVQLQFNFVKAEKVKKHFSKLKEKNQTEVLINNYGSTPSLSTL